MKKITQEKFHSALDSALKIVAAKRESGYASSLEKFSGDLVEQTLSTIVTVDEFNAVDGELKQLIFTVLYEGGETVRAGMLAAIINGTAEVVE